MKKIIILGAPLDEEPIGLPAGYIPPIIIGSGPSSQMAIAKALVTTALYAYDNNLSTGPFAAQLVESGIDKKEVS